MVLIQRCNGITEVAREQATVVSMDRWSFCRTVPKAGVDVGKQFCLSLALVGIEQLVESIVQTLLQINVGGPQQRRSCACVCVCGGGGGGGEEGDKQTTSMP